MPPTDTLLTRGKIALPGITSSPPTWEQGGYKSADGMAATTNVNITIRTAGFIGSDVFAINVLSGYKYCIAGWSGSTYQGMWTGSSFSKSSATWHTTPILLDNIGNYSFKLLLRNSSESNISPSDSSNILLYTARPPIPYFPIGYVYISVDSTNPSTYFGGTWEALKKCFLYAGDISDTNTNFRPGKSGGSRTKTLTRANLPNEKIDIKYEPVADKNTTTGDTYLKGRMSTVLYNTYTSATNPKEYIPGLAASSSIVKKDQAHDDVLSWTTPDAVGSTDSSVHSLLKTDSLNGGVTQTALDTTPEYLSVYMWKRTA